MVNVVNKETNQEAQWWQPAVQLFFELWGWLVIPLVAALFLGTWLDQQFQTGPILFLVTTGISFIVTILGIVKRALDLLDQTKSKKIKSNQPKDS